LTNLLAEDSKSEKESLEAFLNVFEKYDVQYLSKPLLEDGPKKQLESMDLNQLNPDFVIKIMKLRTKILQRTHCKTIDSSSPIHLTGELLVQLMKSVVSRLNQSSSESDILTLSIGDFIGKLSGNSPVEKNNTFEEALNIFEAFADRQNIGKTAINPQTLDVSILSIMQFN
jgi:hypothetical protein